MADINVEKACGGTSCQSTMREHDKGGVYYQPVSQ